MATVIYHSLRPIFTTAGALASGAKIYVYDPGTTNLRNIYTDAALSAAAANPIICTGGFCPLRYTGAGTYKVTVTTSADVSLPHHDGDNIDPGIPIGTGDLAVADGGTGASTAAGARTNLGAYAASAGATVESDISTLNAWTGLNLTTRTRVASGTTAQAPAAGTVGIRYDTTLGTWRGDNGAAWESFLLSGDISTATLLSAQLPDGAFVNSKSTVYTTSADLTGTIPYDTSIPQVGEGTEVISMTYTAASTTNKLRIRVHGHCGCGSAGVVIIMAVFVDGGADAIGAGGSVIGDNGGEQSISTEFEFTPASTSSRTYTVRVGNNTGTTFRFNGTVLAQRLGAAQSGLRFTIVEYKAS